MRDLAIIIPHLDDELRLRRCLDALSGQVDAGVEVVVVDNGSRSGLDGVARDFPWLCIRHEPRRSAGLARNRGVAQTSAAVLAFIDCDCLPAADWVRHIRGLDVSQGITGGQITMFEEVTAVTGAQLFERVFAFDNRRYVTRMGFSVTANMVTTRAVFEAIGGFKPDVSEDVEWCARARKHGIEIGYDPALLVSHPVRATWPALRHKWQRLVREAFVTTGGGPLARLWWLLRAQITAASILRDVPRVLITTRLSGAKDRFSCLITLCKLRLIRSVWMSRQALTGRA